MSEVIQKFKDWIQSKDQFFKQKGLLYEVSETPDHIGDEVAIWVDFESSKSLSRITLWDTGSCIVEALNSDTGENVALDHITIAALDDLDDCFGSFIKMLTSD